MDITEYFLFAMYCGRLWGLGSGPDTQVLLHGAHTLVRDTVNRLTSDSDIKKKRWREGVSSLWTGCQVMSDILSLMGEI